MLLFLSVKPHPSVFYEDWQVFIDGCGGNSCKGMYLIDRIVTHQRRTTELEFQEYSKSQSLLKPWLPFCLVYYLSSYLHNMIVYTPMKKSCLSDSSNRQPSWARRNVGRLAWRKVESSASDDYRCKYCVLYVCPQCLTNGFPLPLSNGKDKDIFLIEERKSLKS